ncbi:MAG: tetratricopeptide repeat protein [Bdellovibrionales bacterium]
MKKVVLLAIMVGFFLSAVAPAATQETYRDIIDKAKNLSLQKDRLQATKTLIRAAQKEKGVARKELIQTLQELSEIFYTEKGQQLFELGQSLKYGATPDAIERFQDSLALEPSNVQVLKALARAHLSQNTCEKLPELVQQLTESNPFEEEHVLLRLQSAQCLAQKEVAKQIIDGNEIRRSDLKMYVDLLRAQMLAADEKLNQAEQLLEKLLLVDKKFPETTYWLYQVKRLQKKEFTELGRAYLNLCKNISQPTRNKYRFEPRICNEQKKVEADFEELKNKTGVGV